jgi:hypothetical protein
MKHGHLIAALAAVIIGIAAPAAHAQSGSAGAGQFAAGLLRQLEAQGYDTTGFENLTLAQINMIQQMLGDRTAVQGILDGACGRAVLQTADPAPKN